MINPVKEAIYSATYVDNYIDSVENLPDDVQRHLSRIRDIDVQYRNLLRDVDHYYDLWRTLQASNDANNSRRSRAITRMQQSLIQAQELGDEKMKVVNQLQELIDHKTRQLDTDQKNLDIKEGLQQHMQTHMQLMDDCHGPTPQKRSRTQSPVRDMLNSSGQPVNGGNAAPGSGLERSLSGGKDGYGGYAYSGTQVLSGQAAGTQAIGERTLSQSNGVVGTSSQGGNGSGVVNISASAEQLRAGGKRARRRNETLNSLNMEHTGNDSNSATEAGSNSAERGLNQGRTGGLTGSSGSVGSKKHLTQNQGGLVSGGQIAGGGLGIGGAGAGNSGATAGSGSGSSGAGVVTGGSNAGGGGGGGSSSSSKKKKRKTRGGTSHAASVQVNQREETPPPDPIDPDEPTYCVCNQISFGEMILCDNDLCPIEWFHFSCVSLVLKPKGKWYCPNCRGDRPNVMKPKAQFLKELERYNKEKEEKT